MDNVTISTLKCDIDSEPDDQRKSPRVNKGQNRLPSHWTEVSNSMGDKSDTIGQFYT
jgi:hypothetical protein